MEKDEKIRSLSQLHTIRVLAYGIVTIGIVYAIVQFLFPSSHSLCTYQRNLKIEDDYTILLAANEIYFDELKNLVGSIHFWEPMRRIVIYDLGISSSHKNDIISWCNVILRPFIFEKYPPHVQHLENFAFLPLIINENLDRSSILWLSIGVELRRSITNALQKRFAANGHWTSTSKNSLCHATGYNAFLCFNTTKGKYKCEENSRVLMDSTHIAVKKNSYFHLNIIREVASLALREECLVPPSYEQSLFSMSLIKHGMEVGQSEYPLVVRSDLFANELPTDERIVYDTAIYNRQRDPNKPYSKYVQYCCNKEEWLIE